MPTLARQLTRVELGRRAGDAALRRGEACLGAGAVGDLRLTAQGVAARVQGSECYQVELRAQADGLAFDCRCPRAADGYFCKHAVALGLAWLDGHDSGLRPRRAPWRDIRQFLASQPTEASIERLLEAAGRDERLYRSLRLQAEQAKGASPHTLQVFRRAIDDATRIDGFLDWRDARGFAGDVAPVVDSLAKLLEPTSAGMLVELAEYAIERLEQALGDIDDSGGDVGYLVETLGDLHLRACGMAHPPTAALAERLLALEASLPFGLWSFSAWVYRDALGAEGLARYRELAQARWRALPPRAPGASFDAKHGRLKRIVEQVAKACGDIDELVAIKASDLASAWNYVDIAETLAKAGRPDAALAWAERGLHAFPEHTDARLRDFLVAAYLQRQRHDEALHLRWRQFDEHPALDTWCKLHAVANPIGRWSSERERALARVAAMEQAPATPNVTLRVEIALWEKDLDAAWAAVQRGGCNRATLIALAGKLESARHDDALTLYRRVLPTIVDETNNRAYAEAIALLRRIGALMGRHHQGAAYADYLAALRAQFRPKRNFIKLLDELIRDGAG